MGTQCPRSSQREGRVEGGSKTELEQINSLANEAVGRDAEIVLRRFLARSMVGGDSSLRKMWGDEGRGACNEPPLRGLWTAKCTPP